MRHPTRRASRVGVFSTAFGLTLALVGCGGNGEEATDVEAFCAQASANQTLIIDPPLADEQQIAATIEFYRLMGDLAPIEISDDWQQLSALILTANDLVPGDEASEQLVAQTAYAAEASAYNIAVWTEKNCGVKLPITTIVSHTIPPAQAPLDSFVPPPTTEPGAAPPTTGTAATGSNPTGTTAPDPATNGPAATNPAGATVPPAPATIATTAASSG